MNLMTGKIPLDLVPFIAKAMAKHRKARYELDCIYAQGWLNDKNVAAAQKKVYTRYYRQNDPLTEFYCHRATGLLMIIEQQDGEIHRQAVIAMEQIIKKCWRDIYTYVKHAQTPIYFDSFWLRKVVNKKGKINQRELCNLPELFQPPTPQAITFQEGKASLQTKKAPIWKKNMLDGEFAIFMSLASVLGKSVLSNTEMLILNIKTHLSEQERIYNCAGPLILTSEQKKLANTLWHSIIQTLNGIPDTLEEYLRTNAGKQCKYIFTPEQLSGLPVEDIHAVIVSRKQLRSAIDSMAANLPDETIITAQLKQDALDLFAQTLFTRACAAEYEKVRKFFICKEFVPAKKSNEQESQNAVLQKQLAQSQKKNLILEQALAQKQEILNELQLKIDKIEIRTLKEKEELQKKLDVFSQAPLKVLTMQKRQIKHEISLSPGVLKKIMLLNVVIIGGRIAWQQRIKQKYPNFNMISSQDVRFDLALLDAADVIVVNWRVLGHSLLHRAVRYAEKLDIKVVYLNMSNEKHLLQTLYREYILHSEKFVVENVGLEDEFQNGQCEKMWNT